MTTPISSGTSGTSSTDSTSSSTSSGTSSTSTGSTSSTNSGSSSSQPLQIFGLASGLDTNAIITKLIAVYSAPMQIIQQQQAVTLQKEAAWDDIKTKMTALQTSIHTLQGSAVVAAKTGTTSVASGQTAAVNVTAAASAALGNFTINVQSLATTATLNGASGITTKITTAGASSNPLTSEGFGVTPTLGTLTVNGVHLTIDSSTTLTGGVGTDSLEQKLAGAGVTLTTTTNGADITGVTLTSTTSGAPMQLGALSDTSNILTSLRLSTSSQGLVSGFYAISSNGALAGQTLSTAIGSAALATPLGSTIGTMTVNGTDISYNTSDTIGSIIGKINNSNAGVTATYDALSDRMTLTASTTGTGGISVIDTSGNLGAALGLIGGSATSTPGMPAVFSISGINGGSPISSATNTVTNLVPGVTINLTGVSPTMNPADATTVTIGQDNSALSSKLQDFVTAYNAVQDTISQYTAIQVASDGTPQSVGLLAGDSGLSNLARNLDQTVNAISVNVGGKKYSMASLGISTGAAGALSLSSVPTLDLTFDTNMFTSALAATPALAQAFLGNGSVTSQQGTLFDQLNDVVNSWTSPLGTIGVTRDALTSDYVRQQTQIQQWQDRIQSQRDYLVKIYTDMETSLSTIQAQGQSLLAALGSSTSSSSSKSS